jgi:uncharacterized protein YecT (DUF1311 family)
MKFGNLAIAVICCTSINAFAVDCNNPPGGIGLDAAQANLECAEQDRAAADRSLNDVYKKLLTNLKNDPEQQRNSKFQIIAAQRAWVTFRDAECDFRANLSGSAPQWLPVNRAHCLTELTVARMKVLQGYNEDTQSQ